LIGPAHDRSPIAADPDRASRELSVEVCQRRSVRPAGGRQNPACRGLPPL